MALTSNMFVGSEKKWWIKKAVMQLYQYLTLSSNITTILRVHFTHHQVTADQAWKITKEKKKQITEAELIS